MIEIYKDVKGYEGYYEVSNLGNVRSINRTVKSKFGTYYHIKGKCLKKQISNKGYYTVILCKNHKKKLYSVHKLVALAFINNDNNYPCVNHKDCNKLNNNADNLEWCAYSYNNLDTNCFVSKHSNRIHCYGINVNDGSTINFSSLKECAKYFNTYDTTINRYLNTGRIFKKYKLYVNYEKTIDFNNVTNKYTFLFK